MTSRRVPPGPILDALRKNRSLPDWMYDVDQTTLEHALRLADGDPRRITLNDDGTLDIHNHQAW